MELVILPSEGERNSTCLRLEKKGIIASLEEERRHMGSIIVLSLCYRSKPAGSSGIYYNDCSTACKLLWWYYCPTAESSGPLCPQPPVGVQPGRRALTLRGSTTNQARRRLMKGSFLLLLLAFFHAPGVLEVNAHDDFPASTISFFTLLPVM